MVGRYDARVSKSLTRAFPARLAPVVTSVVQSLPTARFEPSTPVTASNSHAWAGLAVAGEPVVIPYRIYNPDGAARPAMQASLSAFLGQNRCFAELTRRRAVSYWSC